MTKENVPTALRQLFANPPPEYWPVPWWAWAGKLDLPTMRRQLFLMHEQGIREFFVFPTYGLQPEYLGEEYLQAIGLVLEWCQELGMCVWIYDEYTWPSGTAAGRVPRNHPDAVAWTVKIERHWEINRREALNMLADDSILHICAIDPDGRVETIRSGVLSDVRPLNLVVFRLKRDENRNMTVRAGLWCKGEPGMLDILSASACKSFIDEAYEPFARRFSDQFGATLKGFFTDEPLLVTGTLYSHPTDVPWSPALPELFHKAYGYDLIDRLHDLALDTDTSERTRLDFWSLVGETSSDAFTGQIARWCERRGLLLTGHFWPEETPVWVYSLGDITQHLRKIHAPGCDLLHTGTSFDNKMQLLCHAGPGIIKTPKLAASAARCMNRSRAMCEAFGCEPWSRTMADEKKLTDWLVALGINLINDNSLISDISGFRKRALSGKHFTQPWWERSRLYYSYAARLCAVTAATVLDTELVVLFPTTSWQTLAKLGEDESKVAGKVLALDVTLDALVHKHWDFEFLFEDVLEESSIKDGALATKQGTFRTIILAGVHRLRSTAAERLRAFAAAGGRVILIGSSPAAMEPDGNRELNLKGAITLAEAYDLSLSEDRTLADFYQDWVSNGNQTTFSDELDAVLQRNAKRTWRIDGEGADGIISSARSYRELRSMLFLANQTAGEKHLNIGWDDEWSIELWEAGTGRRWHPHQSAGLCNLRLPEGESLWVVQAASDTLNRVVPPDHLLDTDDLEPAMVLHDNWAFRAEPANIFWLACKLLPDPDGSLSPSDVQMMSESCWLNVKWGDTGIALDPERMSVYWLRMEFDLVERVDDLQLVVDSSEVETAYLNGCKLAEPQPLTVWDDANLAWAIGGQSLTGRNHVLLRIRTSAYYSPKMAVWPINPRFVEPVILRGSFAVRENAKTVEIQNAPRTIRIGDWGHQGFPHFAGTGVYERRFVWRGPSARAVFVCDCGRDVVEVLLDEVSLGARAWGPRRFAAEVKPGEHRLQVRVTNTLGGILRRTFAAEELHTAPVCGLLQPVRLYALKSQPEELICVSK